MKTLLDSDYITVGDKAQIRLFYKTSKGRSIETVSDFKPYFYALAEEDVETLKGDVENLSQVEETKVVEMLWKGRKTNVLKIVSTHPKEVPKLREDVRNLESSLNVFEADIPFARRFMLDSKITPMEHAEDVELNIASVDIEVYNKRGEPNPNRNPIIMISYADNKGFERVWTFKTHEGLGLDYLEVVDSEAEVIRRFVETVSERKIDIITGYNSDNFDFPYIKERSVKTGVKLCLGVDGRELKMERRGMNNGARITGRPHIDVYPIARKVLNIPRYRLEDVYEHMFGIVKPDVNYEDIPIFWDSKDVGEFKTLVEYSLSDVKTTLEISLELLPLEFELSRFIRQPIYETSRMSSSQRVENLLIRKAHSRNILVPNRPSGEQYDSRAGEEKFEGAFVVEPKRGIHDNIVLFDFRSLYPSIIISHNVDPDTLECDCCPEEENKSPAGHKFCTKVDGFIPHVLGDVIKKRMQFKSRMKEIGDEREKRLLDVQQNALKLIANSMYGYYGFERARWYCRECAESITAWGREYIHKAMEFAEKDGFEVIYGDTDSVYITKAGEKDEIITDAKKFQGKINKELPEAMDLEFEGFYTSGIFITKKRYALMDEQGKLTIKGLETRRRDWCRTAKETQKQVLDALLKDKDPDKAAEIVKKVVEEIKGGGVPLADLAINTQMTRSLGEYVNEGPHIQAVRKAMKKGREFKQGDIITYIQTRKGSSISDRARIIDFVDEGDYDAEYYVNNQLIPAVFRILESLGYSEDELKGLGKQMNLGDF